MIEIRLLGPDDAEVLEGPLDGVFDGPIRPERCIEFLADPRHHLAVAVDGERVVGMASAVHYVHPDKEPELWIDEVGVAPECRGRGIGRRLVDVLLERARVLGCVEAWVLTERDNRAAVGLYEATGGVASDDDVVLFSWRLGDEG